MTNLCRDEATAMLKDTIEQVYGSSFNVNGLGGILTCGCTGMGAGLSHAPQCKVGGAARVRRALGLHRLSPFFLLCTAALLLWLTHACT